MGVIFGKVDRIRQKPGCSCLYPSVTNQTKHLHSIGTHYNEHPGQSKEINKHNITFNNMNYSVFPPKYIIINPNKVRKSQIETYVSPFCLVIYSQTISFPNQQQWII